VVSKDEGMSLAIKYDVDFVEISAKTGESINELFTEISKNLCKEIIPEEQMNLINFECKYFVCYKVSCF